MKLNIILRPLNLQKLRAEYNLNDTYQWEGDTVTYKYSFYVPKEIELVGNVHILQDSGIIVRLVQFIWVLLLHHCTPTMQGF